MLDSKNMEKITIYDSNNNPLSPPEITLGQIFEYEIVIINGSIFRNTDTLDSLGNGGVMTLLGSSSLEWYNKKTIYELRIDFLEVIKDAKENEDMVILLEEGIDTKYPYICANGLTEKRTFWNTVETLNELRELLDFQNTLLEMKGNKKKVETVNQKLSEYMKTIKDFYGEISIKTLKDNYDDSFEISFYTDKIDDTIIKTLEKYKDYEVYDVRCEQYCSLPPIDHKVIILDNRKTKPW